MNGKASALEAVYSWKSKGFRAVHALCPALRRCQWHGLFTNQIPIRLTPQTTNKLETAHWLSLTALIAAIILLVVRELLLLLFAAVVLAMALCTLVGILRERRPMQRLLALVLCIAGLLLLVAGAAGMWCRPSSRNSLLLQKLPEAGQTLVRMGVDWIDTISEAIYGTDAFPDIDELELNGPRQLVPDGSSLAAGVGGACWVCSVWLEISAMDFCACCLYWRLL